MHTSGILRFDESVNDMSFFSRFKFTNKGPETNNILGPHIEIYGKKSLLIAGTSC